MKNLLPALRVCSLVSFAAATGMAQASIVTYNTQASYLAALSNSAVDTFSGAPLGISRNVTRTIGSSGYSYNASERSTNGANTNNAAMYTGTAANPSLSSYFYGAQLVLDGFGSSSGSLIQTIGGNFYNVGSSGTFSAGSLTLTALDNDGTTAVLTVTENNSRANTFFGFVSTTTLASLTITPGIQGNQSPNKPTVDNLTLGSNLAQTVPEPGTAGLALAGVVAACWVGRRRTRA